jgi:hypothetical protein
VFHSGRSTQSEGDESARLADQSLENITSPIDQDYEAVVETVYEVNGR